MKKIVIFLTAGTLLISCGNSGRRNDSPNSCNQQNNLADNLFNRIKNIDNLSETAFLNNLFLSQNDFDKINNSLPEEQQFGYRVSNKYGFVKEIAIRRNIFFSDIEKIADYPEYSCNQSAYGLDFCFTVLPVSDADNIYDIMAVAVKVNEVYKICSLSINRVRDKGNYQDNYIRMKNNLCELMTEYSDVKYFFK
jgi:hypothetical protein